MTRDSIWRVDKEFNIYTKSGRSGCITKKAPEIKEESQ